MNHDLLLSFEFIKNHPTDAAHVLEQLKPEETASFLKQASPSSAVGVIRLMDSILASRCLEVMDSNYSGAIIAELPFEISSLFLRRMEEQHKKSILETLPLDVSGQLRLILRYHEGTAGALMDPKVFIVPEDVTVKEGIKRFRKHPRHLIYYIYVVNRDYALVGQINIRDLLLSDPNALISSVMQRTIKNLSPHLSSQAILAHTGWQEFHVLPVVDEKGIFLGAIGYRTIRRLIRDVEERRQASPENTAGKAMGELYWLGLSGLINWVASAVNPEKEEK
ncbi:MAG TPA: CBS domain-containing protein [Nitrospinota bacterium]|nr:CBS domain-containing protein [Nitrospinota bacterium]